MNNLKLLLGFTYILLTTSLLSQNLIPNPGFELKSACPDELSEIHLLKLWLNPSEVGTPDYFNVCSTTDCEVGIPNNFFGDSIPSHTGEGYVGFGVGIAGLDDISPFKEYVMIELSEDLMIGQKYVFSLFAIKPGTVGAGTSIQAHLSSEPLETIEWENIDLIPNLMHTEAITEETWIEYTVEYTSDGTEEYLTIGNFQDAEAIFQSIVPVVSSIHPNCENDYFGQFMYHIIDDVSLRLKDPTSVKELSIDHFLVSPNPITSNVFAINSTSLENNNQYHIEVLDQNGRTVMTIKDYDLGSSIDVNELDKKGIYYLKIIGERKSELIKILVL